MTPGEGTKGSDIYRAGNQGGDGGQVSVIMCVAMVTGVHHNEQPGDLDPGEGAHMSRVRPRVFPLPGRVELGGRRHRPISCH